MTLVYASDDGNVFKVATRVLHNASVDTSGFDALALPLTPADELRYKAWVVVKVKGVDNMDVLYAELLKAGDVVLVVKTSTDGLIGVVRKHKRKVFKLALIEGEYFAVTLPRGPAACGYIVMMLKSIFKAGVEAKTNVIIKSVLTMKVNDLRADWAGKRMKDIEMEIAESKSTHKDKRSRRQALIVSTYTHVLSSLKHEHDPDQPIKHDAFGDYVPVESIQHLDDTKCFSFDVETGEDIVFSLRSWLTGGKYVKYSLVMLGRPEVGKTPTAMAFASTIARAEQDKEDNPFFVKVSTLEGLRASKPAGLLRPGVPVVLDDVSPSEGVKGCSSLEEVKHVTNVQTSETFSARYDDFLVSERVFRIITSNKKCPKEWHSSLPANPQAMSPADRLGLSSDVKAVFKRVVFANCEHVLVPRANAKRMWQEREGDAASKVARVLGR